jgi:hypothetical protein
VIVQVLLSLSFYLLLVSTTETPRFLLKLTELDKTMEDTSNALMTDTLPLYFVLLFYDYNNVRPAGVYR